MPSKARYIFHLLPNAHLDPVWLWDWREGLNEGLTTVQTVLNLMDEHPELTFLRGEALIYRHIQKASPKTFERILLKIAEGRWDVVGGTYIQPDSNLSSTETLCRHFEDGLAYFEKEMNVRPTISWQADSFGHTAGWPNILRSFGMEGFAFTRPQRNIFPLDAPVFWWECDHDDRLLCYRQYWNGYCSERFNIREILDATLCDAILSPWKNVGVLIGLGNHGGGPTRRHLEDVEKWRRENIQVEVRYSTLHHFFQTLREEIHSMPRRQIPVLGGEFGYCLRGCYSSVQKFKNIYRASEALVTSAEASKSLIGSRLGVSSPATSLEEAWESVLFNSFHDILPGSSIERAVEDQTAWVGGAIHHAQKARFEALNRLAAEIDTRVPSPAFSDTPTEVPILVWNSLPRKFTGPVEIEASLDYRPLFEYENHADEVPFSLRDHRGRILPCQEIATEHSSLPTLPWRKRVVTNLSIPPMGWRIVRLGLNKEKVSAKVSNKGRSPVAQHTKSISNTLWEVICDDKHSMTIKYAGKCLFLPGQHLRLFVVEDPWGSWGGMNEERESFCLDQIREEWEVTESAVLESGPERSRLWTRWQGKTSWIDLTFDLCRSLPWIEAQGRLLWNERSARLQFAIPSRGVSVCDVPGSIVRREERGQSPIGRWFYRQNGRGIRVGLASDVLSDADFWPDHTRVTLARASRYANDVATGPAEKRWQPATDCGELKFRLALFSHGVSPDHVADHLVFPPVTMPITPSEGALEGIGSFGRISPSSIRLLSIKETTDKQLELRIQNRSNRQADPWFKFGEKEFSLGPMGAQQIKTIRISP